DPIENPLLSFGTWMIKTQELTTLSYRSSVATSGSAGIESTGEPKFLGVRSKPRSTGGSILLGTGTAGWAGISLSLSARKARTSAISMARVTLRAAGRAAGPTTTPANLTSESISGPPESFVGP